MSSWFVPWWGWARWPFSGNVTQRIAPVTSWFSPQIEFDFAGDEQIEAEVIAKVTSYGDQLGVLSHAVLELANGKPGDKVAELKELMAKIDRVKQQHADTLENRVKSDLRQLKRRKPEVVLELLQERP
jgi:hypothetical protein